MRSPQPRYYYGKRKAQTCKGRLLTLRPLRYYVHSRCQTENCAFEGSLRPTLRMMPSGFPLNRGPINTTGSSTLTNQRAWIKHKYLLFTSVQTLRTCSIHRTCSPIARFHTNHHGTSKSPFSCLQFNKSLQSSTSCSKEVASVVPSVSSPLARPRSRFVQYTKSGGRALYSSIN